MCAVRAGFYSAESYILPSAYNVPQIFDLPGRWSKTPPYLLLFSGPKVTKIGCPYRLLLFGARTQVFAVPGVCAAGATEKKWGCRRRGKNERMAPQAPQTRPLATPQVKRCRRTDTRTHTHTPQWCRNVVPATYVSACNRRKHELSSTLCRQTGKLRERWGPALEKMSKQILLQKNSRAAPEFF